MTRDEALAKIAAEAMEVDRGLVLDLTQARAELDEWLAAGYTIESAQLARGLNGIGAMFTVHPPDGEPLLKEVGL